MEIIDLLPKHAQQITPLWLELMEYHEGHTPYFQRMENHEQTVPLMLKNRLEKENEFGFVAFENQEPIAFIMLRIDELPNTVPLNKRGYIAETIVSSLHRSKGIGEQLVLKAKAFFKTQNCDIVELQVSSKNPSGLKFWQSLGFYVGTHHMLSELK